MIYCLVILASILGLSEQGFVFTNSDCPQIETFSQQSSLYCPFNQGYTICNSSVFIEDQYSISCAGKRTDLVYKNGTGGIFIPTKTIKCENGNFTNSAGQKVVNIFTKPTCASKASCDKCVLPFEPTCPANFTCNPANFIRNNEDDGCDRIKCANNAKLNIYDNSKNLVPYTSNQLYCTTSNKWFNYSFEGTISSGGTEVNTTTTNITANCVLPKACENCIEPNFVTNQATQIPLKFRTGYKYLKPTVSRQTDQCATTTCPNGYILMGFTSGTNDTQTGVEFLSAQFMSCDSSGLWRNGYTTYTPQSMYTICTQKITACPPTDNILNSGPYTVACNVDTKVSSLTCPSGQKLTLRYSTESTTTKYERATFFEGKGWLAHACDATAGLFTTVGGRQINAYCS